MTTELLERIEVPNAEYEERINRLAVLETNIETHERIIEETTPILSIISPVLSEADWGSTRRLREAEDRYRKIATEFVLEMFPNMTTEELETSGLLRDVGITQPLLSRFSALRSQLETSKRRFSSFKRDILNVKEHLEGLNPDPSMYIRDQIDAMLLDVEGVVPGSVYLTQYRSLSVSHYDLHWIMKAGMSTVNNLNMERLPWFHVDKVQVEHPECEISINLRTKELKIIPIDPDMCPYLWEGTRNVHPHILNSYKPCLGDFNGPVAEAVADQQWGDVATLLNIYLSNVDAQDSAGAHWAQYFYRRFGDQNVTERDGATRSSRGYKHYFMDDQGQWEMKLSKDPNQLIPMQAVNVDNLTEDEQGNWVETEVARDLAEEAIEHATEAINQIQQEARAERAVGDFYRAHAVTADVI